MSGASSTAGTSAAAPGVTVEWVSLAISVRIDLAIITLLIRIALFVWPHPCLWLEYLNPRADLYLDIPPVVVCVEGRLVLLPERIVCVPRNVVGLALDEPLLECRPLVTC